MNDEGLDGLFREAAENYRTPFDPQAWEKMEKRLDGTEGERNNGNRKNILRLVVILLFIALLAGYGYFRHRDKAPVKVATLSHNAMSNGVVNTASNNTVIPATGISDPAKEINRKVATNHASNKTSAASRISASDKTRSGGRSLPAVPGTGHPSFAGISGGTASGREMIRGAEIGQDTTASSTKVMAPDGTSAKTTDSNGIPAGTPATDRMPANNFPVKDSSLAGSSSSLQEGLKTPAGHATGTKRPATFYRWYLGLVAGPDLATVKFRQWTSPGVDAGLRLGYRITPRFSVESGILLASKIYAAKPSDYHPKQINISNYYYLKEVDANCLVLDVPLNLRYDFFLQNRHRFFVSTGLSSFWMKEENYTYKFNWNLPDTSRDVYDQNRHLFSIWNISAGYERQLGNRLSLQVAPFVKLPLSGVGYGRVKLTSTGILFSLQYGL